MAEKIDMDRLKNEININPLDVNEKCNYICSTLWNELSKKDKVEILLIKIKNLWKLRCYEAGLACCNEAYSLVETEKQLCELYIINAIIEMSIGNYLEAGELNFKALKIAKEINDWKFVRRLYNNIGTIYLIHDEFEEAYEYCLKIEELDRAYGEEIVEGITTLHQSLSKIYAGRGEYKKAFDEVDKMIVYSRRNCHKINEATGLFGKAMILKKIENYNEAMKFFQMAKKILNELNVTSENLNIIKEEIDCYYKLGDINSARKLMADFEKYIMADGMNNYIDYMDLFIKISNNSIEDNNVKIMIQNMINEHYEFKENKRKFIIKSLNGLRDRKNLEFKNQHIENKNRMLEIENNKVEKDNRSIKIICEIGKSILSLNEEEKLISLLDNKLKSLGNIDGIGLLLVDENNIEKAYFMHDGKIFNIEEELNPKKTMSYSVLNNNLKWFLSNSVTNDFIDILPNMKSALILPLVYEGKINGILTLQNKCEDAFSEEILEIIKELAEFIAISVNNTKIKREMNNEIFKLQVKCKEKL